MEHDADGMDRRPRPKLLNQPKRLIPQNELRMKLPEIRQKIDALDEQLFAAAQRAGRSRPRSGRRETRGWHGDLRAGARGNGLARARRRRTPSSRAGCRRKSIRAIYREIMSASLALEKDLTIAYFGPEATNTHQAARSQIRRERELHAARSASPMSSTWWRAAMPITAWCRSRIPPRAR